MWDLRFSRRCEFTIFYFGLLRHVVFWFCTTLRRNMLPSPSGRTSQSKVIRCNIIIFQTVRFVKGNLHALISFIQHYTLRLLLIVGLWLKISHITCYNVTKDSLSFTPCGWLTRYVLTEWTVLCTHRSRPSALINIRCLDYKI
jgi:hypothetical protein